MHVVVIDRDVLPAGTEFPALDIPRYGWEEYAVLSGQEFIDRRWRADFSVAFRTPLPPEMLDHLAKARLIVIADGMNELIDPKSAAAQGISVSHVNETAHDPADKVREIAAIIEAFQRGDLRNTVDPVESLRPGRHQRRASKNSRNNRPHSSANTPAVTCAR
jgi:phosphoglycerate dehydrogenase-like enzyme